MPRNEIGILRAFACGVKGTDWTTIIHHTARGKAKYAYYVDVRESWPDIKFTDITCTVIGPPVQTDRFLHTKGYRGVSFSIGTQVDVNGNHGFVVGSNASTNFGVLFISGKWKGKTLNCHPSEIKIREVQDAN